MNNDHERNEQPDRLQALWAEAMKPVRMKAFDWYGDFVNWIVAHLPKSAQHWLVHKFRIVSPSTGKCPFCRKEYM